MDRNDVELDGREILHDGFFRMEHFLFRHRLFEGGWSPQLSREILVRNPVAAVIPYDPIRDEIVLIEQFRGGMYAAGDENPWSLEVVAGIIEAGESAAEMAIREAREESGCELLDIEKIMDFYPSPGGCSEVVALFWGRVSTEKVGGFHGVAEEGEDIRVFAESTDDALKRIADGSMTSSIGIIAAQWLALNRDELHRRFT
ncbi:MAG: ADP-ribose pyrophosphatase [Alphaproteobacteria bacterium]|jgi:ADP-ribose pyrophosphatase